MQPHLGSPPTSTFAADSFAARLRLEQRGEYDGDWNVIASVDGEDIAALELSGRKSDGELEIGNITVLPEFRLQGLGRAMLNYARSQFGVIHHAPESQRTPDGLAWSRSVGSRIAAMPVRGIPLEDLFASARPTLEISVVCRESGQAGKARKPFVAYGGSVSLERKPASLRKEIDKLEASAKSRLTGSDSARVIDNYGGVDRIVLIGSGNSAPRVVLAEKSDWSAPWRAPKKNVPGDHGDIEPVTSFFNHLSYGSDDELMRVFLVDVAGGVYDDRQFDHLEEGQKVVVYRGISLPVGADPTNSVKDGQGAGSSWTLNEQAAMAIAERGRAGFSGDNTLRNDVSWVGLDVREKVVPTVLRAEVELSASGAAPYRPWSNTYASEQEIDLPRGQAFTLTGWKQAKGKPVSSSEKSKAERAFERSMQLERDGKYDDPAWMEGRRAGYYVHWEWGSWKRVSVKRTASSPPKIIRLSDPDIPGTNFYAAVVGGQVVGAMSVDGEQLGLVYVLPAYRRAGVASSLLAFAREIGTVGHSNSRTRDGAAWSRAMGDGGPFARSDDQMSEWDGQNMLVALEEMLAKRLPPSTGAKFRPSQMVTWEQTRPWSLTPEDAKAQMVDGWWYKSTKGSESASWQDGYIRPTEDFFRYPEGVRRAIAYHEAGHAMIEAAGGITADDFDLLDSPGGQTLGYNAEEILAEAYSVLWGEPEWFDRMGAGKIKDRVIQMAKRAGFPLPASARTASLPSWRLISVVDTREFIEGENDRWYPVVGSGSLRACDRCGKSHEIHATMEDSTGRQWTVGVGCALKASPELDQQLKAGQSAATTLAKNEAEVAALRERLIVEQQVWDEVQRLPAPGLVTVERNGKPWRQTEDGKAGVLEMMWVQSGDQRGMDSQVIRSWREAITNEQLAGMGWKRWYPGLTSRRLEEAEKRLKRSHKKASSQTLDRAYRGVPVVLTHQTGVPILEALAKGQKTLAAHLLIDAMSNSTKRRWWAAGDQPEDEAGRWWTNGKDQARAYASGSDDGWLIIPVLMTAEFTNAGTKADIDGSGRAWWHLPAGKQLTITQFEACWPEEPQALLDSWRGVTSPGNFDEPNVHWDGEWTVLPVPKMKTSAALWGRPVNAMAAGPVVHMGTPRLKYDYYGTVERIAILDPDAPEALNGHTYFTSQPVEDYSSRSRRDAWDRGEGFGGKPRTKTKPKPKWREGTGTADPGTIAFLDFIDRPGRSEIFIAYMSVRDDFRRQGHARQLIDWVYAEAARRGRATVDWGTVFYPANRMYWEYLDRSNQRVNTVGHPLDGRNAKGGARMTSRTAALMGRRLWWRIHPAYRPFSPEEATSVPIDNWKGRPPARGYSAVANPWHLWAYAATMGWLDDRGPSKVWNDDVLGFTGEMVGGPGPSESWDRRMDGTMGEDGEPLVIPDMGIVERYSWAEFERELLDTPFPGGPLHGRADDSEQEIQSGRWTWKAFAESIAQSKGERWDDNSRCATVANFIIDHWLGSQRRVAERKGCYDESL